MSVPDLWPKLTPSNELTPLGILRNHAARLFRKTNGLLEGDVVTEGIGTRFRHHFNITAPALGHFTYELFFLEHGLESYPARAHSANAEDNISSEAELLEWIRNQMELQKPTLERLLNESMTDSMRAELVG
jgi:hypothetical protein